MKIFHSPALSAILLVLAGMSCASLNLESRLDTVSRDFFNHARYIITREESKIFLELPPSSQTRFIEEFWQRRDPTPETEENEFREAYYRRIEEANRLFRGARPGWLQERGQFYILFGPPDERRTNPMGGRPIDATDDHQELTGGISAATGEKASEVWTYYNLFSSLSKPNQVELVFVDSDGTGNYVLATNLNQLIPGGIDSLLKPNIEFTHELYKEENIRSKPLLRWVVFDFDWEILKVENKAAGSNMLIRIALPYKKTIFRVDKNRLQAPLRLDIMVRDASQTTLWEHSLSDTLDISRSTLDQNPAGAWEVKVPVPRLLGKGRYFIYLRLENASGDQSVDKLLPFKM
ncbi:MAG TPA: GWxTD domain-containing protein [Acidobacteriota bacterium]